MVRQQLNASAFQIDNKTTAEHEKELILFFMLMPVILTLHDTKPNNGVIHLAQCLIVPRIFAGGYQSWDVH